MGVSAISPKYREGECNLLFFLFLIPILPFKPHMPFMSYYLIIIIIDDDDLFYHHQYNELVSNQNTFSQLATRSDLISI